jgi:zinc protease
VDIRLPSDEFTLDNGLRVVVHEDRRAPLACVDVWYHVGSKDETPGRTGFAHLFEHLMFEGSEHVPEGAFDAMLESVGGINNGSTSPDRTDYWEVVPAHAVDLALYLEADRMGGLLPAITSTQLEVQRGVVMNERRQSCENRPYGLASETLLATLYDEGHPYRWPVIGSMADIEAATLEDVQRFCATWYTPNNATMVVAGDVSTAQVRATIEHYFGDIPRGQELRRPTVAQPRLAADRRVLLEDDVTLPRIYMAWHTPPAYADGDAALDVAAGILASGRASRLHRTLVHEQQVAQSVSAYQASSLLGSMFRIAITGRPDTPLASLEEAARAEIRDMAAGGIGVAELERARNAIETEFIDSLQNIGGFGGRADQINTWLFHTGHVDYSAQDVARYRSLTPALVADAVERYLHRPAAIACVVPHGRADIAGGAAS